MVTWTADPPWWKLTVAVSVYGTPGLATVCHATLRGVECWEKKAGSKFVTRRELEICPDHSFASWEGVGGCREQNLFGWCLFSLFVEILSQRKDLLVRQCQDIFWLTSSEYNFEDCVQRESSSVREGGSQLYVINKHSEVLELTLNLNLEKYLFTTLQL